ncbi:hypothetical protein [Nonomuraea sp. NPDC049400]|uniref:hypothetical protein n=1 Tax=Nonomuraea sp. NPDC049400 TaxID=3364352 RepID=UPI0037ADCAA8
MPRHEGFDVDHRGLEHLSLLFTAEKIRGVATPYALPENALSILGEGQRKEHDKFLHEFMQELNRGDWEAKQIGEKFGRTSEQYYAADNAAVRRLIKVIQAPPGTNGDIPRWTPLPEEGRVDEVARATYGFAGMIPTAVSASVTQFVVLNIATMDEAVLLRLYAARNICAAFALGTGVWLLMMVPSDEDLIRAVNQWGHTAQQLRAIFGHDFRAVRDALADVWSSSEALSTADRRVAEFIAAGVRQAMLAQRMADTLAKAMKGAEEIHARVAGAIVLITAIGIVLATMSFNTPAQVAAKIAGHKATLMISVAAAIVSAVYLRYLSPSAFADVNAPVTITDHDGDVHTVEGWPRFPASPF